MIAEMFIMVFVFCYCIVVFDYVTLSNDLIYSEFVIYVGVLYEIHIGKISNKSAFCNGKNAFCGYFMELEEGFICYYLLLFVPFTCLKYGGNVLNNIVSC